MDFVFLMHAKEDRRVRTGTGRLAHLCLENSELLVADRFGQHPRVLEILADESRQPMLLYPGTEAWNISERGAEGLLVSGKRPCVFVIDGTWIHARKILYHAPILQALPRIVIRQDEASRFTIKRQPAEGCLCTIEACHAVLRDWNGAGARPATPHLGRLLDLLARLVRFQSRCATEISNTRHPCKRKDSPS